MVVVEIVGGLVALDDVRCGRSFAGAEYDCWRRDEVRTRGGAAVDVVDMLKDEWTLRICSK